MTDHRLLSSMFRAELGRHVAECSCGWRSAPVGSAGVAGSLYDEHTGSLHDLTVATAYAVLRQIELAHTREAAVDRRAAIARARTELRIALEETKAQSADVLAASIAHAQRVLASD